MFIEWCFAALAIGRMPLARCDGAGWDDPRDAERARRAGEVLPFRGALCKIKGDLAEFVGAFGFPTVASFMRPCLKCNWFSLQGNTSPL